MILQATTEYDRRFLLEHLAQQSGETPGHIVGDMPFHVICCHRKNQITAVICYLNYRRESMEFHAAVSPGGVTRSEIRHLFAYPFEQLGVLRLWSMIRRNHKDARSGADRLGFKVTGVARDEFGPGKDGIIYSMRRAECPWLQQKVDHHGR